MRPGEVVSQGAMLGTVKNLFGDVLEEVMAPEEGVVLFQTSSPAVNADGLLLGLGAGRRDNPSVVTVAVPVS